MVYVLKEEHKLALGKVVYSHAAAVLEERARHRRAVVLGDRANARHDLLAPLASPALHKVQQDVHNDRRTAGDSRGRCPAANGTAGSGQRVLPFKVAGLTDKMRTARKKTRSRADLAQTNGALQSIENSRRLLLRQLESHERERRKDGCDFSHRDFFGRAKPKI